MIDRNAGSSAGQNDKYDVGTLTEWRISGGSELSRLKY